MARALWKGSISFGLVTIPIGLVSAVEASEQLSFNLLHKKDGSRLVQRRFCQEEDVEVPWAEVVKGYQYAKGQYVVITDEDFEKARVPATQMFDIRAFVPTTEVEDVYFEHPYYVTAEGRGAGPKAYGLLRDVLKETGKLGIGTIVLRQREHLAALEPFDEALVLTTMRYADEIRSPKELGVSKTSGSPAEMKLARQLVDSLSDKWKPQEYHDTYTDVLRQLIEAKVKGEEIVVPEMPKRPRVANLMKALEASLKERPRLLAKAPGRQAAGPKRARPGKRRAA